MMVAETSGKAVETAATEALFNLNLLQLLRPILIIRL
jgi:hypothetical protein